MMVVMVAVEVYDDSGDDIVEGDDEAPQTHIDVVLMHEMHFRKLVTVKSYDKVFLEWNEMTRNCCCYYCCYCCYQKSISTAEHWYNFVVACFEGYEQAKLEVNLVLKILGIKSDLACKIFRHTHS